ncbi:GNAT family N-acetyltransferase [Metabacillus sp. KIGAM252]|uniref:GNAT family N-acetyltransferase n=1 Tax=Metabacillus flavus TaxID=2823519 RepID=A0ABS5LCH3_9BACI|nr:GNAT family protein [Metabacillus flavus]MBS2968288.1 GNAT family N-acetyltransferase [Metabacillus flavus]
MITGKKIYLRFFTLEDASERLRLQQENRAFFEKFSMERQESFYTLEAQEQAIANQIEGKENDEEYQFGIFTKDDVLIGTINLFFVARGAIQSGFIGYFMDERYNGRGYTTEAVNLLVQYAFEELKLHRIEAGVMPHNIGSIKVLTKAGFHKEGLARKNVKINGRWEDHELLAIVNPKD